ncbi:hypothetical protein HPB50_011617 [Hyalomma asiaticum]|uniref:Uncharacterized protein n=1 Tax=Hyalomma asiaticum TaxID=266040 RepID=A0ACB7TGN1_HYAAI|nr:hypothetical protein HPB50_011617 [Hyalomma asiaticum]
MITTNIDVLDGLVNGAVGTRRGRFFERKPPPPCAHAARQPCPSSVDERRSSTEDGQGCRVACAQGGGGSHSKKRPRRTGNHGQPRAPVLPSPTSLRLSMGEILGTSRLQHCNDNAAAGTRCTELRIETLLARSNELQQGSNKLRAQLRVVGTRQADALEQLVAETRRQWEASEHEAAHLAEAVRELRSIGELAWALTASLRWRPAQA